MKTFLGISLMMTGIIGGIWLGLIKLFAGGLIELFNGLLTQPANVHNVVYGLVKILIAGPVGWIVGGIIFAIGLTLAEED